AKKTFERFLAAFPHHELSSQVRFELGNARLSLGDLEGSALAYASAAEATSQVKSSEGNGDASRDGASGSVLGAAGADLLPARALYQKAMLERRMGKPAQAVETLSTLLVKHQEVLKGSEAGGSLARDTEYQRAIALLEGNHAEEAQAALTKFLEKNGGS